MTDGAEIKIGTVEVVSSDNTNFVIADTAAQTNAANVVKITSDGTNATVTLKDGKEVTNTITAIKTAYGIEAKAAGSATISKQLKAETTNATIAGTYTGNLNDLNAGDAVNVKLAIGASGSTALSSSEKALILSFQVGAYTTSENKIEVSLYAISSKVIIM